MSGGIRYRSGGEWPARMPGANIWKVGGGGRVFAKEPRKIGNASNVKVRPEKSASRALILPGDQRPILSSGRNLLFLDVPAGGAGLALRRNLQDPLPLIYSRDRLRIYDGMPEEMKSPHIKRMLELERLMDRFLGLDRAKVAADKADFFKAAKTFMRLAWDIIDVYAVSRTLPYFEVAYLVNMAYAKQDAVRIRIDLDVTTLNHIDPTGNLADMLLPEFREWLLGIAVRNPFKYRVSVVQLADRTSFSICGPDSKKFVDYILKELDDDHPYLMQRLFKLQEEGYIPQDSAVFRLGSVSLHGTISQTRIPLKSFVDGYMRSKRTTDVRRLPHADVLQWVLHQQRISNASSIFLKAHPGEEAGTRIIEGGFAVYNEKDIPPEGDPLRGIFEAFVRDGRGTIPYGVYGYHDRAEEAGDGLSKDIARQQRLLNQFPDYPHELGTIYGHKGSLFDKFFRLALELSRKDEVHEGELSNFKKVAEDAALRLLGIGAAGMRDPRAPFMVRETRMRINTQGQIEPFDPFLETAAMYEPLFGVKYNNALLVEVDDFRAAQHEYPPDDDVDGICQKLKKIAFDVAEEFALEYPIVGASEGDQIRFLLADDGQSLKFMTEFARRYQQEVKEQYKDRQFQVYGKKLVNGRVVRLPKWIHPSTGDEIVATRGDEPVGYVAARKGLTVTVVIVDIPDLAVKGNEAVANEQIRLGFSYVDHIKKSCNYLKELFGVLPADYTNGHERRP